MSAAALQAKTPQTPRQSADQVREILIVDDHPLMCDALALTLKISFGLKNVRINNAGCLDRCELGPTLVIYPEGVWYSCATKEDIDEVLETHLLKGDRVERLMLTPQSTG